MQTRQNSLAPASPAVTNLLNEGTQVRESSGSSAVDQFIAARQMLLRRRQDLERELAAIGAALQPGNVLAEIANAGQQASPTQPPARKRGEMLSLVVDILAKGPLEKDAIIERLRARVPNLNGDARRAVDSVIYGKRFRRNGKIFSLAQAA